jgi:hypothetical protein
MGRRKTGLIDRFSRFPHHQDGITHYCRNHVPPARPRDFVGPRSSVKGVSSYWASLRAMTLVPGQVTSAPVETDG